MLYYDLTINPVTPVSWGIFKTTPTLISPTNHLLTLFHTTHTHTHTHTLSSHWAIIMICYCFVYYESSLSIARGVHNTSVYIVYGSVVRYRAFQTSADLHQYSVLNLTKCFVTVNITVNITLVSTTMLLYNMFCIHNKRTMYTNT